MKDLKSQPKKGRYFPLSFVEALAEIKAHALCSFEAGDRIALRLQNVDKENPNGHIIVDLSPKRAVTLYSLPDDVPPKLAEKAAKHALKEFAALNEPLIPYSPTRRLFYIAYLGQEGRLILTKCLERFSQPTYRATSKFSNAFKRKNVIMEEEIIQELNLTSTSFTHV